MVTGVVPSPARFLPPIFIARRAQQSHCSSISRRVLLTHALAFSASQFVRQKKSPRIYASMHALGGIRTHETDLYSYYIPGTSYIPGIYRSTQLCCCCCCCSHISNSHNQVRGHRTGSSPSGAEKYPGEKTQTNGGTRIYLLYNIA